MGATLLAVSATLGIWAQELAQTEALSGWLRTHPPSGLIWKHALESKGYLPLSNPKQIQHASRTLPSLVDEEGSAWASTDASWIALYQKQAEGLTSVLYCLDCGKAPLGWQPAGRGWESFDSLLARADQAAAARVKPAVPPRRAPIDPLEIQY